MKLNLSNFLQRRTHIHICRTIGWQYALSYIQILGRLYFFSHRGERRTIRNAIRSVFSHMKNRFEMNGIARGVFKGIFSHYYEKLFNVYATVETADTFYRTHIDNEGLDVIRKGLSKGRGVLLITGHYGGVEFIPGYLSVHSIPVSIVVRFSTDHLKEITLKKADTFNTKIIDADKTPNIMKAICDDLKNNRVVVTQCDEIDEWRPAYNNPISFLGVHTFLDRTMNVLIKRARAETIFGLMHRNTDHRYRFIAANGKKIASDLDHRGRLSLGAAALKFLEQYIMKYPAEWYQWKKHPEIPTLSEPVTEMEGVVSAPVLGPSVG